MHQEGQISKILLLCTNHDSLCTDTSLVSHMADGPLIFILQFAADVKAEIVGKPSETFFSSVLEDMGVSPENVRQT